MKISFNWKWPNGRRHARIKITYNIDPEDLAYALVCHYSADHDAGELPTNLKRSDVDRIVRDLYAHQGSGWNECGAYDNVEHGEVKAFDTWAGETVRRCYPELDADRELAKF